MKRFLIMLGRCSSSTNNNNKSRKMNYNTEVIESPDKTNGFRSDKFLMADDKVIAKATVIWEPRASITKRWITVDKSVDLAKDKDHKNAIQDKLNIADLDNAGPEITQKTADLNGMHFD